MRFGKPCDHSMSVLSRRKFLGGMGGVAASSAVPSSLEALGRCSQDPSPDYRPALSAARIDAGTVHFPEVFAPSDSFVKPSERPFRRDICLNGAWRFQAIALPAGFQKGQGAPPVLTLPEENQWEASPVFVPSPWNVNSFADHEGEGGDFHCYPSYPDAWEKVEMAWLSKTVTVPVDWKGRAVFLHFDAVAGDAVVMVNGKTLGNHFDIFLPFSFDATDAIFFGGVNEVLVGVRKASLFDKKGAYGHRTYQGGSFWGQHVAGIWQDVFLVAMPPLRVADVYVLPKVDTDTLQAEVTLQNDSEQNVEVSISAEVFPWLANAGNTPLAAQLPSSKLGTKPVLRLASMSLTSSGTRNNEGNFAGSGEESTHAVELLPTESLWPGGQDSLERKGD